MDYVIQFRRLRTGSVVKVYRATVQLYWALGENAPKVQAGGRKQINEREKRG